MTHDPMADTRDHISKVHSRLNNAALNLTRRALIHDDSKFSAAERPGYEIIGAVLRGHTYGTPEYQAAMAEARQRPEVQGAIEHHYATNDHHPEHHKDGIAGMSLLSLMEWVADCKAASERTPGGVLRLDYARFGIDPQLARILENTVRELGW